MMFFIFSTSQAAPENTIRIAMAPITKDQR